MFSRGGGGLIIVPESTKLGYNKIIFWKFLNNFLV